MKPPSHMPREPVTAAAPSAAAVGTPAEAPALNNDSSRGGAGP